MTESETINTSTAESRRPRRILQSVGAVFAAFVAVVVLSVGTDIVLHATGIYPPWFQAMSTPLWVLATGYRTIYGIAGGYIAARLAPNHPMVHAIVLGVVGLAVSIAGVVVSWNQGPEFGPRWYPLALVMIAVPCAWLGGKLRERQ
jgi:hypothetical protein